MKQLFTVKELSDSSGYSVAQIHNQIERGNIRVAFKSPSLTLIQRSEFTRVINLSISRGKYKSFKRSKYGSLKKI